MTASDPSAEQAEVNVKNGFILVFFFFFSVGLPVANAPDVPQPCGLLYYP
jgi:hypothetical protein